MVSNDPELVVSAMIVSGTAEACHGNHASCHAGDVALALGHSRGLCRP